MSKDQKQSKVLEEPKCQGDEFVKSDGITASSYKDCILVPA